MEAWVFLIVLAAAGQTTRTVVQRSLVAQSGTGAATLARFIYGLPVAALLVLVLHLVPATREGLPRFTLAYAGWILVASFAQITGTVCLLMAMTRRNFVVSVAYSKTDAILVALFGILLLGEWPSLVAVLALLTASAGVMLLSFAGKAVQRDASVPVAAALYGLGSGIGFALTGVGFRGAALELAPSASWLVGAWGVLWVQGVQTLVLVGWLLARDRQALGAIARSWRASGVVGAASTVASFLIFTGTAMTVAANVRAVMMIEVAFSYAVSRRLREHVSGRDKAGLAMILLGVIVLALGGRR